jgi:putative membrane protein
MTPQQAFPLLSLTTAFPIVMKNHLRGENDAKWIRTILGKGEFNALSAVVNKPQYVLARLRQLARESVNVGASRKESEVLMRSAYTLGQSMSMCESIYETPIPMAYSRHMSRFLITYVTTLPLILVRELGWTTLPIMAIICWALFGILEIGNLIEEPFTAVADQKSRHLLPLIEICRTIQRDVCAIAQYAMLAKTHSAPHMEENPEIHQEDVPQGMSMLSGMFMPRSASPTKNYTQAVF